MSKEENKIDKARLGAIGENNVVSILMQHDWEAFNANCSIKNFKSIDIICLNSEPCTKGSTYEFNNIKTKEFPFFTEGSEYTDDSILTFILLQEQLSYILQYLWQKL